MFVLSVLAVVLASIAILVAVVACKKGKKTQESATSGRQLLDENIEPDIFDSISVPTAAAAKKRTARPTSKKGKQSQKEKEEKQSTRNQGLFGSRNSFTVDNPANSQIEMATLNSIDKAEVLEHKSHAKQNNWNTNPMQKGKTETTIERDTVLVLPRKRSSKAMFAYDAADTGEISLVEGEDVVIEKGDVDGWTQVKNQSGTGLVPTSYLENQSNRK